MNLTGFLVYLKHHVPFIWNMVERVNGFLFRMLYRKRFLQAGDTVISGAVLPGYVVRRLDKNDLPELEQLLNRQSGKRMAFFKPHGFDMQSLKKVYANPAFLMMGVFSGNRMAGYFFLRCFWNRKCFTGRLVDEQHEGMGIGRAMKNILYPIAWQMGFRCYSTISKNNHLVIRSHAGNASMRKVKDLGGDYMLVEFIKADTR